MLNPFSISLAVQPLKIYSGLCLNEGSSLTHRAPLILGEKTNSRPADTRLTVPFPSPRDSQPLPRRHSPPPLQPHQHLGAPVALGMLCVCPTPRAQVLPTGCAGSPASLGCSFGRWVPRCLPPSPACPGMERGCKFLSAGAAHCQALITALLQGPGWLGWILGSGRAPQTALMDFDRT